MTNPSKSSLLMFVAFFIGALINYAFNVVMGWMLTPEEFGMLGVSASFLLILTLFVTYAFPLTATKFISGKHEEHVKHRVFKSSLSANVCIAIALSLLFYAGYATNIINLGENYNLLVICLILATLLTAISVVYLSILQGTFRFKSFAAIKTLIIVAKFISGVILVQVGLGAFGALLSFPLSILIGLVITFVLTKNFNFWKTKGWADSNVYMFAFPMFFGALGATLLMNIDIIGVKFLTEGALSDTLSGYYRAALVLAQLPVFMATALMSVLFPYISKHTENEQYSLKSIKYGALFILPFALVIATIPETFISLMFPPEYLKATQSLAVVSIGMGFLVMTTVLTNIFQARNAPKIPAIALSLAVVIEIILLIKLIPLYGMFGAAISTMIACSFGFILLVSIYIHTYKFKLDHIAIIKTLVSFSLTLLVLHNFPHADIFSLIVDLILSATLYVILLAVFNLFTEEDLAIFLSGMPDNKAVKPLVETIFKSIKKLNRT